VPITIGAWILFLAMLIGGAANGRWWFALLGAVGTVALGWLNWKWATSSDGQSAEEPPSTSE
jgi:hypothetical protein